MPGGKPRKVNDPSKLSGLASASSVSVTDSTPVCPNTSLNSHVEATVLILVFTRPT